MQPVPVDDLKHLLMNWTDIFSKSEILNKANTQFHLTKDKHFKQIQYFKQRQSL